MDLKRFKYLSFLTLVFISGMLHADDNVDEVSDRASTPTSNASVIEESIASFSDLNLDRRGLNSNEKHEDLYRELIASILDSIVHADQNEIGDLIVAFSQAICPPFPALTPKEVVTSFGVVVEGTGDQRTFYRKEYNVDGRLTGQVLTGPVLKSSQKPDSSGPLGPDILLRSHYHNSYGERPVWERLGGVKFLPFGITDVSENFKSKLFYLRLYGSSIGYNTPLKFEEAENYFKNIAPTLRVRVPDSRRNPLIRPGEIFKVGEAAKDGNGFFHAIIPTLIGENLIDINSFANALRERAVRAIDESDQYQEYMRCEILAHCRECVLNGQMEVGSKVSETATYLIKKNYEAEDFLREKNIEADNIFHEEDYIKRSISKRDINGYVQRYITRHEEPLKQIEVPLMYGESHSFGTVVANEIFRARADGRGEVKKINYYSYNSKENSLDYLNTIGEGDDETTVDVLYHDNHFYPLLKDRDNGMRFRSVVQAFLNRIEKTSKKLPVSSVRHSFSPFSS